MVVGEVWQRGPVLAQCVVAGVGVVVVVTVRNICRPKQTHRITSAAVKFYLKVNKRHPPWSANYRNTLFPRATKITTWNGNYFLKMLNIPQGKNKCYLISTAFTL